MFVKLCLVAVLAVAFAEDEPSAVLKVNDEKTEPKFEMKDVTLFEEKEEGFPELTEDGAEMVVTVAAQSAEAMLGFDDLEPAEKEAVTLATADSMMNMMENFGVDSNEKLEEASKDLVEKDTEEAKTDEEKPAEKMPAEEGTDRSDDFDFPTFGELRQYTPQVIFLRRLAASSRIPPFMVMQEFRNRDFRFSPFGFAQNPVILRLIEEPVEGKAKEELKLPETVGIFNADGTIDPEIEDEIDAAIKETFDELKGDEKFEPEEEKAITDSMKDGMIDTMAALMIDSEAMEAFDMKMEAELKEELEKEKVELPEDKVEELKPVEARPEPIIAFDLPRGGFGGRGFGGRGFRRFRGNRRFNFFRNFAGFFAPGPFSFNRGFGGFPLYG